MSLLGPPSPVMGWTPASASATPAADAKHLHALCFIAVDLCRRRGALLSLGQQMADAYHYFQERLLEGRHEAAEVRYALGLPAAAELPEVLAAIKARAPA